MKKIISLALVFVFALAIPAFAEVETTELAQRDISPINGTYQDQTGNADVTYNVSGNYIVTVPDAITLTAASVDGVATSDTMSVVASKVLIPYGDELQVSVGGAFKIVYNNGAGNPADTTNEDEVTFKIVTAENANITSETVILKVNKNGVNEKGTGAGSNEGSVDFTVATIDKPKYNESYTGTITFTTSVVTYTPPQN